MGRLRVALCVLPILAAAGCGDGEFNPYAADTLPQTADVLKSDLPRETAPAVDASELVELVAGNNEFACDLYREIRGRDGNLVFSPYSISTAYATAYAGARGATETQMADALRFSLAQERLHPTFNDLDLDIVGRAGDGYEKPRLDVVNSLWGQTGYPFLPGFLDVLAVNYGAGIRVVDFTANPETARLAINEWASDETEGMIQDLVPRGAVSSATVFVLANTVYFSGRWAYPFPLEDTTDEPFHLLTGSAVDVPTMYLSDLLSAYAEGPGWKAVEIYYTGAQYYWEGSDISMMVVLPDEGEFQVFENSLTVAKLDQIVALLGPAITRFKMPRFSCESSLDLHELLPAMGMVTPFSPANADFSGMSAGGGAWIEASGHKARISVDEYGTEAAAGTYAGGWLSLVIPLTIDRPFIFLIRDRPTGTILFLGRVLDPRG